MEARERMKANKWTWTLMPVSPVSTKAEDEWLAACIHKELREGWMPEIYNKVKAFR